MHDSQGAEDRAPTLCTARAIRVCSMPAIGGPDPYKERLYGCMDSSRVSVATGSVALLWPVARHRTFNIIHLHNVQGYLQRDSWLAHVFRIAEYFLWLIECRLLGMKIVWTVHNYYPHEARHPTLERLTSMLTAHLSNSVLVHFKSARVFVQRHFAKRNNIFVIPQGNFVGCYPNSATKTDARHELGLDSDSFVYLFFGNIRPYKGLEHAVGTFSRISRKGDVLLVAGQSSGGLTAEHVTRLCSRPRVRLHLGFVPTERVQLFFHAADIVLLPYHEVCNSGQLALAMTFGKPVICPTIGAFDEVAEPTFSIRYEPGDVGGLGRAMSAAKTVDLQAMGSAAYRAVSKYRWEEIGPRVQGIFEQLVRGARRLDERL